ncbi:hypothetical protein KI427_10305 [Rhodococcus ruber]|uniref:hypothetical protein n=1 Tax=Rhodococcus ruber TaxID=1830 RepID=UPI0013C48751|nr:hypothetical protein [Rhodococcus ruber]UQB74701.1 hypothetical protein KI427_10305 [Rhodococcus ruber]
MPAAWGSIPDWIAALGSPAAIGALLFTANDYRSRSRELRDNEADQARLIAADLRGTDLGIENHSDQPIYQFEIETLEYPHAPGVRWTQSGVWDVAGPRGEMNVISGKSSIAMEIKYSKPDGSKYHPADPPYILNDEYAPYVLTIQFTDVNGRRWRRTNNQAPTRVFR